MQLSMQHWDHNRSKSRHILVQAHQFTQTTTVSATSNTTTGLALDGKPYDGHSGTINRILLSRRC